MTRTFSAGGIQENRAANTTSPPNQSAESRCNGENQTAHNVGQQLPKGDHESAKAGKIIKVTHYRHPHRM